MGEDVEVVDVGAEKIDLITGYLKTESHFGVIGNWIAVDVSDYGGTFKTVGPIIIIENIAYFPF